MSVDTSIYICVKSWTYVVCVSFAQMNVISRHFHSHPPINIIIHFAHTHKHTQTPSKQFHLVRWKRKVEWRWKWKWKWRKEQGRGAWTWTGYFNGTCSRHWQLALAKRNSHVAATHRPTCHAPADADSSALAVSKCTCRPPFHGMYYYSIVRMYRSSWCSHLPMFIAFSSSHFDSWLVELRFRDQIFVMHIQMKPGKQVIDSFLFARSKHS